MNLVKKIPKRTRLTLNKQIARAPTHAKKWEIALHGGLPPTQIQMLPSQATGLRFSSHPEDWNIKAKEQLKGRFAQLLFPALMENNPAPFLELLEAMAKERREVTRFDNGLVLYGRRPKPPKKKEAGRKLRLAILSLTPDDLISMRAVLKSLENCEIEYSDESHVRRVMREMDIHLLKPGDTVYLRFSEFDLHTGEPKEWQCVRKFVVEQNGTVTNYGLSQAAYDELRGWKAHRVRLASPDK